MLSETTLYSTSFFFLLFIPSHITTVFNGYKRERKENWNHDDDNNIFYTNNGIYLFYS
jgi:hypothetical protein